MSISVEILVAGKITIESQPPTRQKMDIRVRAFKTLKEAIDYLGSEDGKRVGVVIVDFQAATEGIGGGDTTMGGSVLLEQIKARATYFGRPTIIGVSGMDPFLHTMRAMKCDKVCRPTSLESELSQVLEKLG